jgi:predicted phosphodiesterase
MCAVTSVGLISDTHGLLRPEALLAPRSSDLIIHAGDVRQQLRALAPVVAVGKHGTHWIRAEKD